MSLHCACGGITDVTDSRTAKLGEAPAIRRRRRCRVCSARLTTFECSADLIRIGTPAKEHELGRVIEGLKTLTSALASINRRY